MFTQTSNSVVVPETFSQWVDRKLSAERRTVLFNGVPVVYLVDVPKVVPEDVPVDVSANTPAVSVWNFPSDVPEEFQLDDVEDVPADAPALNVIDACLSVFSHVWM